MADGKKDDGQRTVDDTRAPWHCPSGKCAPDIVWSEVYGLQSVNGGIITKARLAGCMQGVRGILDFFGGTLHPTSKSNENRAPKGFYVNQSLNECESLFNKAFAYKNTGQELAAHLLNHRDTEAPRKIKVKLRVPVSQW